MNDFIRYCTIVGVYCHRSHVSKSGWFISYLNLCEALLFKLSSQPRLSNVSIQLGFSWVEIVKCVYSTRLSLVG